MIPYSMAHGTPYYAQMIPWILPTFIFFDLQKDLDFKLKVIGGDISTIPGLYGTIEVCTNSTSLFNKFILAFSVGLHVVLCLSSISVNVKLLTECSGLFR